MGCRFTLWGGEKSKFKALYDSIRLDVEFSGTGRDVVGKRDGTRKQKECAGRKKKIKG